jgi:hypothetical protein
MFAITMLLALFCGCQLVRAAWLVARKMRRPALEPARRMKQMAASAAIFPIG